MKTCAHSWKNADCTTPKQCTLCGEQQGAAIGHSWKAADCTNAKKCTVCGEESGFPLSHSFSLATCEKPKTCEACGYSEGGLADHTYKSMKCTVCGAKDPEYKKIQEALKNSERYVKYNESDITIISGNIELYEMTGKITYLAKLIDAVDSATDNLDGIRKYCGKYDELKLLVDECYYSIPAVSSSNQSSVKTYIKAAKQLVNTMKKANATYAAFCSEYGVK